MAQIHPKLVALARLDVGDSIAGLPASRFVFPATLLCRSRDFVKSSAERAHRWTGDAHRARGIAWTLFMRRERGPRLDMEPVDGSGKGVGEDERAGGGEAKRGHDLPVKVHARGIFFDRPAELRRGVQSWEGLA